MRKRTSEDLLKGGHYAIRGLSFFFSNSDFIAKTILPYLITLVIYLGLMYGGFCIREHIYMQIDQLWDQYVKLPDFFDFLSLIIKRNCGFILFFVYFAFVMLLSVGVFELICNLTNCSLPVEYFKSVHPECEPERGSIGVLRFFIVAFYNVWTLIFLAISFFLLLWLPLLGQILTVMFLSYRLAFGYLSFIGYRLNIPMRKTARFSRHYYALTMGYGIALYVFFALPYIGGFLLPGLYIGGVMIFKDYFLPEDETSNMPIIEQ